MSAHAPATILFVNGGQSHDQPLIDALRSEGYAVREVFSGDEALRLAQEHPSLVILDLNLPDMSGTEVCRRIRASLAVAPVLLLHVSGDHADGDSERLLNGTADACLLKPVTPQNLLTQVRALLRVRRVENALLASEMRLQDILDHAPVVVFVKDTQGRYLLVNRLWEQRFRLPREQVIGKPVHEIHAREQSEALLANDRRVLETGEPLEFEEEVNQAGERHTYLSVKFPLLDASRIPYAVCGISMDISDRKIWEKALLDSEALYESLVESLPVCILRKDVQGRFTFANRAFCKELGKRLHEVVGKTDLDFYPEELARKYMADDRRVLETGELFTDVEEHQAEGTRTYVEVIKSPLRDSQGQMIGTQALFWDVTARKMAEEELARTAAEFRVARRIQQRLFPTAAPRVPGMEIAGHSYRFDVGGASYPAEAIGGDYYDYLSLTDGTLGVAIGDVSGHGIGPALLMAEVRAYLRGFAQTHSEVSRIVGLVNRTITQDIEGDRFITLLMARLDPAARTLTYASAGHSTGYVFDAGGTVKHALRSTSIPLGIFPESDFPSSEPLSLEPGDLVLFLTDGVVEARSPDGGVFGARRACEVVRVYRESSARQIVENLYYAVRAFSQNRPQVDDITATVIKVAPKA